MSESPANDEIEREERIDTLLENAEGILNQKEEIDAVFENTIGSDLQFNNFDQFLNSLRGCLYGYVDEEETRRVTEALVNTVASFSAESADRLKEEGENGQKLLSFLTNLEAKYKIELSRRTNRVYQGNNWWSNIKTEIGYRSNQPHFRHEITIDYQKQLVISTDPHNTLNLAHHFIQQIIDSKDTLGEDVLDYIPPELVKDIEELSSELSEAVEEYPEDFEEQSAEE